MEALGAQLARGFTPGIVYLQGDLGTGKTTLAQILAVEMELEIRLTSGPAFQNSAELIALLSEQSERRAVFIDEIHRLPRPVEEYIYKAMEDFRIDFTLDGGVHARTVTYQLKPFTLVGATTRAGLLTSPLRDRFGIVQRLEFYSVEDLTGIVHRAAGILGLSADESGPARIAERARGTPRIANRLLRRVRDFAEVREDGAIDAAVADRALAMLEVDVRGLDVMDRKLLSALIDRFGGGPVGIESLAAAVGEERDTLEDVVEPFLIQQGFLQRTPRGRVAAPLAYAHFGLTEPRNQETGGLF